MLGNKMVLFLVGFLDRDQGVGLGYLVGLMVNVVAIYG